MVEASFVGAFALWSLGPGLLLLWAAGSSWSSVERVAGAGGLSIASVSIAAYLASAAGLPVTPLVVVGIITAWCGAIALVARRQTAVRPGPLATTLEWCPPPSPAWTSWLVLLAPVAVVWQLEPLWSMGLLVPPTLYDGLDHANWFRLILDTRSVAPSTVMAPPLNPDGSATFYPWGLHAWLAVVAGSTSAEPMTVFWRGLVGISAMVPLSIFVFAARFTGRGWPALSAAALSLLFWWLPYQAWGWGGYALLAGAVAALPISRVAIDACRASDVAGLIAAAVTGAGLLLVHPSQAMSALIISAVVTVTLAFGHAGRWRDTLPFLAGLGVVSAALVFGASIWTPLQAFVERAHVVGDTVANDPRYAWPGAVYAGMVWYLPGVGHFILLGLYAIGGLVALRHATLRPLLILHLVFSVMVPLAGQQTWVTAFWYHAPERIWYLQYACLPILGALGFVGVFQFVHVMLKARGGLLRRQSVLWPLALVLFLANVQDGYTERADNFVGFFGYRSRPIIPTDPGLRSDFAWIEANVPAGEVLFNASADWGVSLPFTGHRTVFWSGGYALDPSTTWHRYQERLNLGDPHASFAARELARVGVRYVYAAVVDPRLAIDGREPLAIGALQNTQALESLYTSTTGAVFRIAESTGTSLGLRDSERLRFEEGFWSAEESDGQTWRWTNGDGRVAILPARTSIAGCAVQLIGPDPAGYEVSSNGERLRLTAEGFRLPVDVPAGEAIDIAIQSAAAVSAGTGTDDRVLGVRVYDIRLACG